jgi:hypothetical protein
MINKTKSKLFPAKEEFFINAAPEDEIKITTIDVSGKTVLEKQVDKEVRQINVSGLNDGL